MILLAFRFTWYGRPVIIQQKVKWRFILDQVAQHSIHTALDNCCLKLKQEKPSLGYLYHILADNLSRVGSQLQLSKEQEKGRNS